MLAAAGYDALQFGSLHDAKHLGQRCGPWNNLLHSLFAENEGMTQLVDEWQQLRLTVYLGSPCLHGVLPGLLQ